MLAALAALIVKLEFENEADAEAVFLEKLAADMRTRWPTSPAHRPNERPTGRRQPVGKRPCGSASSSRPRRSHSPAATPIRRSIPADGTPTAILTIPPATHRTKPGSGEGATNRDPQVPKRDRRPAKYWRRANRERTRGESAHSTLEPGEPAGESLGMLRDDHEACPIICYRTSQPIDGRGGCEAPAGRKAPSGLAETC